ncbi:hypothetical protein [Amycolatopsis sp. NPDC051371]|uniref:hypothetical protein n=1 Tax=Amycolatopsis sp. NPDC051371 TaxID=3155800 RepID=UPI00342CDB74
MTALDDRPCTPAPRPMVRRWEWRLFDADGRAHLYQVAELTHPRLDLLRPWCLLGPGYPLEHDRRELGPRGVLPQRGQACPGCAACEWACIPHPRAGTEQTGKFDGDLFEVVTRDARA